LLGLHERRAVDVHDSATHFTVRDDFDVIREDDIRLRKRLLAITAMPSYATLSALDWPDVSRGLGHRKRQVAAPRSGTSE
jgi:hypothetical protein